MSSFGAWLRKSRELRGLQLDEVADATKLPPKILGALEADDVDTVADVAYALKYVRAAADAIGLDPEDTALRYEEWRRSAPQPTAPPPPGTGLTPAGRLWSRLGAVRGRVTKDPIVWAAVGLTVLACGAILIMR